MRKPQALIIGLGGVGSWVLELLARTEGISYIVGADLKEEWAPLNFDECDEQTEELIARFKTLLS